jgi:hypothetical protein
MSLKSRSGFALPMAVFALAVLAVAVSAGIATNSVDRVSSSSQEGADRALAVAQGGLEQFLLRAHDVGFCTAYTPSSCSTSMAAIIATPPQTEFVTAMPLANGYADVRATLVRVGQGSAASPHIYYVQSRGVDTSTKQTQLWMKNSRPERTVGQYVHLKGAEMQVLSSFTSLTGIQKNGGSGEINGNDNCPAASGGGAPAVAGVAVPANPGYSQNGGSPVPQGSPGISSIGATATEAAAAVKIDWNGIVNQNTIVPDITIPGGTWPASTWASNPNYYPVIKVIGNYALPSQGRGTLIVTGDMTISGSNMWQGIVLVGGNLTSNGNNTVYGAIVTGLNVKLQGQTPPPPPVGVNSVGNGNKEFQYDSCEVRKATAGMGGYVPIPNTWTGNVATF